MARFCFTSAPRTIRILRPKSGSERGQSPISSELFREREGKEIAVAETVGIGAFREIGAVGEPGCKRLIDGEVEREDERFRPLEERAEVDRRLALDVVDPCRGRRYGLHALRPCIVKAR